MDDGYDLTIHIVDGVITAINGPLGAGTPLTTDERKKTRKSTYGLRPVDTLYDHDSKGEATIEAATRKCYMIIGGFKVEVPCS